MVGAVADQLVPAHHTGVRNHALANRGCHLTPERLKLVIEGERDLDESIVAVGRSHAITLAVAAPGLLELPRSTYAPRRPPHGSAPCPPVGKCQVSSEFEAPPK